MTHPYKPTIFALNTRKLDVLPDPKIGHAPSKSGAEGISPVSSGIHHRTLALVSRAGPAPARSPSHFLTVTATDTVAFASVGGSWSRGSS
jgi:hypothetical protein